ncbi:MAG: hypothetical protein ACFCUH_04410 [Flavobacteriales bacterium]
MSYFCRSFNPMEQLAIDVNNFEDIRPYKPEEIQPVIQRLLKHPSFFEMMRFVYPNLGEDDITEMMGEIRNVDDFQTEISAPAFKVIAQTTTSGLTFSNLDAIKPDEAYLFLSNHRDIILDSALLNVSLLEMGFPTTQIAIGDNLLHNDLIKDLVRINKSFIVNRNVNPKEMLAVSKRLSNYIHKTICEDKISIWLAHKEGRSKDGDDRTASGLMKMLVSGGDDTINEALKKLNIVPMVVSYEYDPCDIYKAHELLQKRDNGQYEKTPGEDYRSALKGITGHKGRVNITIGNKLRSSLERLPADLPKNEQYRMLSAEIDRRMHLRYRLWPTNYIAYDLQNGTREYANEYTPIQKVTFRNYLRGRVLQLALNHKGGLLKREKYMRAAREVMLQMYANPVINQREASPDPLF